MCGTAINKYYIKIYLKVDTDIDKLFGKVTPRNQEHRKTMPNLNYVDGSLLG